MPQSPEPTPSLLTPHPSCLARVTGELTMTFPAGIVRVFSGTPPPPVLSFRLVHASAIEHFQPNADLLFRYRRRSWGGQRQGVPEAAGVRELPACEFGPCLLGLAVALGKSLSLRTSLFSSSLPPTPHSPPPPPPPPRGPCLPGPKVSQGICLCRKPLG